MKRAVWFVCALALVAVAPGQKKGQIKWQGYTWSIRQAGKGGPGPNDWDPKNVWVDEKGFLHLKISNDNGHWTCAELETDRPLGFGTYQCQVEGPIDKLDQNIVFSMFSYAGPDGTKEIDIEYAKWGNAKEKNAWWTVYPNDKTVKQKSYGFNLTLDGSDSTSRYTWTKEGVHYWMLGGHQPIDSLENKIDEWNFHPDNADHAITQNPIPLHFNLWLFEGKLPTDGKTVEMIVHSFTFKKA